jgi:hypothetical protein
VPVASSAVVVIVFMLEPGVRGDSCYAVDAGVEVWLGAVDGYLARSGWRWLSQRAAAGDATSR